MHVVRVCGAGLIGSLLLLNLCTSLPSAGSNTSARRLPRKRHRGNKARALSTVVAISAHIMCNRMQGLTPRQRQICETHPEAFSAVGQGSQRGLQECQYQRRHYRWNCSGFNESLDPLLGRDHIIGTKEAAFVHAMRSAGVVHAITRACSAGNLSSCGCDVSKSIGGDHPSGFKWGGCSADIQYGLNFARIVLDAKEHREESTGLMNIHNYRVGRKVVKRMEGTNCKCHGTSGSCGMKTCWTTLPTVRVIGDKLSEKYNKAKKVEPLTATRGREPIFFRIERLRNMKKKPRKGDLVYLNSSPNYCEPDRARGILGTRGRECNRSNDAINSCEFLCCGRGYNTHEYTRNSRCNCVFIWCCDVKCSRCSERVVKYTCK